MKQYRVFDVNVIGTLRIGMEIPENRDDPEWEYDLAGDAFSAIEAVLKANQIDVEDVDFTVDNYEDYDREE